MPFSVSSKPTNEELSEAVNYLLSNFSQTMAINTNTGTISTASYGIVSYLYKFLQIRYADSFNGQVNFSNSPTNRLYYGIRNDDSGVESLNSADYLWLPVTGGFGTTKFVWYATTGGRQIELFIGSIPPSVNFFQDNGSAIDLDLLTIAAENITTPSVIDYSFEIQALEQAIGSIPQPQLGTMAPQNAENVAITGGAINNTPIGATTASTGSFSSLILGSPLAVTYGGTGVSTATANYVFAGPVSGGAAAPTFRALVVADIPALPYGTGNVVGPASATDNAVARFDTTTGKLIQNSVVTISDTGATTGVTTLGASTSVTTPIVQASNSAGLSLKNASGTTQMSVGAGGGDNMSVNVSTNLNGTNAQIDISPTGTGHVHIKPTGTGSVEVAPTNVGTIDNMTIGATTPKNASFVDLSVTGTTSFDGAQGTSGQVLTSAGTGNTPTWTTPTTGTVTSVSVVSANGLAGTVANSTTTPAITLTTSITGLLKGNGTAISAATANTDYMGVAAPVTKTADFTVANGEIWYINNKSGSTCTVTLPAASSWTGRSLTFKNMQTQTLVSASSNVVPIDSTTAGTAILLGVIGNWATMVSDGTNWVIMQAASNNNLLLE